MSQGVGVGKFASQGFWDEEYEGEKKTTFEWCVHVCTLRCVLRLPQLGRRVWLDCAHNGVHSSWPSSKRTCLCNA